MGTVSSMTDARQIFQLLQLNGGTFPTGGFSQSWGLETYVAEGIVKDTQTFRGFLESYLKSGIGKCEGPIICRAYELAGQVAKEAVCRGDAVEQTGEGAANRADGDAAAALRDLEQLSQAMKVTKESREAALRMGKAFGRILAPVLGEEAVLPLKEALGSLAVSYPVIYGCMCRLLGTGLDEALAAYVFSAANTLTQSALKLIPLGNVEAQKVLFEMDGVMEEVTCLCRETGIEEITNFCPGLDIASLAHEELPVRLYMS